MTTSTKVRNRVLGLVAFGFLATTALTANFMIPPSLPVHAETNQQVAPQAGFADLAARVMPAVVSVIVAGLSLVFSQYQPWMPENGAVNVPDAAVIPSFFS